MVTINDAVLNSLRREKDMLEATGFRQARRIANKVLIKAIQTYRRGFDITDVLTTTLDEVRPLLVDAMVAAEVMGRHRGLLTAGQELGKNKKTMGPYDWARKFVSDRLKLTPTQLRIIQDKYGPVASKVTSRMSDHAEGVAKKAIYEIVRQGMHIKDGTIFLRNALAGAGIQPDQPWLFETLVRSQIHVAYGAGRWASMQEPEIDEILWGYEYVSIDDDRVRPTHAALNGTRLPKDDPRWNEIWPPNGYNCRCDVIEIFEPVKPKEPPREIDYEGDIIQVRPDLGWAVNHGKMYLDNVPTLIKK
jgi:phage putative head morphogenesis protein, SPP1 gp7 family